VRPWRVAFIQVANPLEGIVHPRVAGVIKTYTGWVAEEKRSAVDSIVSRL
jgi:hypothetical protein